jgi:hypothetical protein
MNRPASEHHERLERFVCRENVARFRRLLTTESDEAERDMLFRLLTEEQEKPPYVADWPRAAASCSMSPERGNRDQPQLACLPNKTMTSAPKFSACAVEEKHLCGARASQRGFIVE